METLSDATIVERMRGGPVWIGRAQALLDIIREPMKSTLPASVTAGGILRLLHAFDTPPRVRVALRDFLPTIPGFEFAHSDKGFYRFEFVEQMEYLCDGLRIFHGQGLIK